MFPGDRFHGVHGYEIDVHLCMTAGYWRHFFGRCAMREFRSVSGATMETKEMKVEVSRGMPRRRPSHQVQGVLSRINEA